MNLPKITIVTPSYNQGQYLEETIRSVLEQNYPNLEYFVIDGGSTDNSVEIIKKYADQISWWVSEKDRGQSHAINKGLQKASGEIVGWINSDDLLESDSLDFIGHYFTSHPEILAVTGGCNLVDVNNRIIERRKAPEDIDACLKDFFRRWFSQQSTFWRRSLHDQIGYLDESRYYTMDYDLWLRIRKVTPIVPVEKFLARYRFHDQAKCMLDTPAVYRDTIDTFVKHHFDCEESLKTEIRDYVILQALPYLKETWEAPERIRQTLTFRLGKTILLPARWAQSVLSPSKASSRKPS